MRVTRVEIFGFKSFLDRLVLPLEGGVTGVVGPNGCGKSNVVDAIRWVLGETKASSLRGTSLEDVIFNGTDKLRPLGLAEVTLTLRASEEGFFGDLTSSALEAELLAETLEAASLEEAPQEEAPQDGASADAAPPEAGAPAEGHAERSADDDALSSEPSGATISASEEASRENAPAVETAVGSGNDAEETPATIPQLRVLEGRRGSAEEGGGDAASLSTTLGMTAPEAVVASRISLSTRFAWLKNVNEVQVTRRLYRSGESEFFINRVACRLKDLRELFRAVGLGARAYTIVAQGEVSRVVTAKPEERRTIIEEAAGVLGFRDKIASASRRLEETAVNVSRLDDVIKEVSRQVGSLKRQAGIARNRVLLKEQLRELEGRLFRQRFFDLSAKGDRLEATEREAAAGEANSEAQVQKAQAEEQEARAQLLGIDVEGDELRSAIDNIREELNARNRQRAERSTRLNEVRAFALARTTEIKRLEERKTTLAQRKDEGMREAAQLEGQEGTLSQQLNSIDRSGAEDELRGISQELQRLRDELRRKDGGFREVRDKLVSSQSRIDSVQQQIISASPMSQLRKTMGERNADFLIDPSSGVSLLVDGLRVPEALARAVQAVLAERSEFLVSEQPLQMARRFVERAFKDDPKNKRGLGLGIVRGGAFEGEPAQEASVPFPRILDEIQVNDTVAGAARRMLANVFIAPSFDDAVGFFEAQASEGRPPAGVTLVTRDGDLLTDFSFYSFRHEGGIIQLKNRLEELQTLVDDLSAQQASIAGERESLQAAIQTAERRHAEVLRESQQRQAQIRELSNQLGNVRGRLHAARRVAEQVESDSLRASQQVEEARLKIEELKGEEERLQAELNALVPDADNDLRAQLDEFNRQYAAIDDVRKRERTKLSNLATSFQRVRQELDDLRRHRSQLALDIQKVALERQSLEERVASEYGEEVLQSVKNLPADFAPAEASALAEFQAEAGRLRTRIQREGEVDPTAIERFEEESKRLDDLEAQRRDLESAAATLKRTIDRLSATSEERFVKTFAEINAHFSRLVPRLFGGGRGELELTDPAHPLDSGIEILIRPPGKKPKNIDSLSGGEKALCATALIFGMFLVRPGPLCVLDEVDAPLDEANLMRFLALIKEMSSKVQFIMITHNKQSMSMADNLVGVTMLEPGASKVITVSLQEAYSQVA